MLECEKAMNREVLQVDSIDELKRILKEWPGVVIDFWASWSAPAISFRQTFLQHCQALSNDNLVFCSIQIDLHHEAAAIWDVITVPCYAFFCYGKEINRINECNVDLLAKNVGDLQIKLL
jgi:thioredoxin-like negative regulator of GroEL